MKKRLISLVLALTMILSLCATACAVESEVETSTEPPTTTDEVILWPLVVPLEDLYDKDNVGVNDSTFQTNTFNSISGNGKIIRFWFKNTSSSAVKVILQKKGLLGNFSNVKTIDRIEAGSNKWEEYDSNSGSQTYRIKIESYGGSSITGELRCVQTTVSLKS